MVQVEMTGADGTTRSMRLPLALVARLMAAQSSEDANEDEPPHPQDDDLAAAMEAQLGGVGDSSNDEDESG